jgi:hypothetical protein
MSIFNYFSNLNLSDSQILALTKLEVFLNGSTQVFLLKGYAGTGKTTLLKGLVEYLLANKTPHSLMAPTGRAAKVLRDKIGKGATIHKSIYNFERLETLNENSSDDAEHSFHYSFPLNHLNEGKHVIIVDESSMISSVKSNHELFTFGTNILLNDLLTFANLTTGNNKIIFVGDPAQLPPVSDPKSLALTKDFFVSKLNLKVDEVELTDVVRQSDNLILANAKTLRTLLLQEKRTELSFNYDDTSFVNVAATDFIDKFTDTFPSPEIGDGVVISFSNAQCFHFNMAIRKKIFPNQSTVVAGDLFLINNNNYHTYGVELFNGDIAKVVHVNEGIISQSAPVYCDENGEKTKKIITIEFKKVKLRIPSHPDEFECYIVHSLLNSTNRDLSICEMKALYINFMMRFNDQQQKRKEQDLPIYKVGSEEFKQQLKSDPFFNALKVKYGYAITCHKAQGGEWDKVFVDFHGRVSLAKNPLRWCYTAITRGKNTVFAVNAPHFNKMQKFALTEIGVIGKLPANSLSLCNVQVSPFHTKEAALAKSLKYWELKEKLDGTNYLIKNVETKGAFLEQYTLFQPNGENIKIQASHTISGHFVDKFKVTSSITEEIKAEIEEIFNADFNHTFSVDYQPRAAFLAALFSSMRECCAALEITITNVVEERFFVNYYLKTTAICAYIQFYFNDKEELTTAMPKTFNCDNDTKLQLLIQKIKSYAS